MAPALPNSRGYWVLRSAAAAVRSEREADRTQTRPKPVERDVSTCVLVIRFIVCMGG